MAASDRIRGETDILTMMSLTAEISILLYPGAHLSAVLGLTDMFLVANRLSLEQGGPGTRGIQVSHWRQDPGTDRLACVFRSHGQAGEGCDCVIFPPTLEIHPATDQVESYLHWAKSRHEAGFILCSVCGGAFLLAKLGVLDGRSATTHWSYAQQLAAAFPRVPIDAAKLMIDHGDVVTAGGVMAWLDLGLKLIDRFFSPTIMLATARYFLGDPAGRQQRFYASFAPTLNHGDEEVLRVQKWLHGLPPGHRTVSEMAAVARLGERTFLRRFTKATGLTPTRYVQVLKVSKARELLEFTVLTVQEIAWKLGYEDVGSFGKVFRRTLGLSPTEYRNRFGVGGQAAADRSRSAVPVAAAAPERPAGAGWVEAAAGAPPL